MLVCAYRLPCAEPEIQDGYKEVFYMAKFMCVSYDPYDNTVFDFIVFVDKASAKSYARHWRSPGNCGVSVSETYAKYPLNTVISSGLYWKRFQAELEADYKAIQHQL